jgi:nitrogen regulatory protein PII
MEIGDLTKYELCFVVVNHGLGSKILKAAKEFGVSGGTILLGTGTIKSHLLDLLGINDIRREIVLMMSEEKLACESLEGLSEKFKLEKPNHGIAFSIPVAGFLGFGGRRYNKIDESRGAENIMYNAIFTIVDKGSAESVIDAAVAAGSQGGTIINARGSGIHEHSTLFSMAIEPEKEIVMILADKNLTETIVSSIGEALKIDEPGNGVMFILDVNRTYGLYGKKE